MEKLVTLLSLIIGILPIYLIGTIFYKIDTIKEPKKMLRDLFLLGIVSSIIVIIISVIGILLFPKLYDCDNLFLLL